MKKLSIIIPVYNVEKYIEKCLKSCIEQDVLTSDYEIVVINDGTPDNSMTIVERLAKIYDNIRIINQKNQGLSAARNVGTVAAQGEYIWYVDSDDYIEENCLGRIISKLKDELDILQLQHRHVYEDGTPDKDRPFRVIHDIQSGKKVTEMGGLPAPAQFSIYRSTFLKEHKLEFVRGILHEDSEFKPRATYLAKKIASDNSIAYNYLQRTSGSIMSSFKLKNGLDMIKVMNSLLMFCRDKNLSSIHCACMYRQVGLDMNSLLLGIRQLKGQDYITLCQALQENKHLFHCMLRSKNIKYMIEGFLFSVSVKLGLAMHGLMR